MKRFILLVLLLIPVLSNAQQWYVRSITPDVRDVNAVYIQGPTNIFVAGGHLSTDSIQSLYGTNGYSWFNILDSANTRGMLLGLTFTDSLHGYACGYNGNVIKSTDGGQTWSLIPTPITGRNYTKIIFTTALKGFAVGASANDSMETIITTNDGGATWSTVIDQSGPGLNAITFINTDTGFAVGDRGVILTTVNGGSTWNSVTAPLVSNFKGITFTSAASGLIVGGDSTTRIILNSSNGGATWNVLKNESGYLLTDITFAPSKGYIVGYNSTLLTSTDGGQTWTPDTVSVLGNNSLTSVRFLNDSFGMIGAKGGYVFYYTHAAMPVVYTYGSHIIDSADVRLTMYVSTNGSPGEYYFTISTDTTWTHQYSTPSGPVNTQPAISESQVIGYLGQNPHYYYYAACVTLAGTSIGDTLQFYLVSPHTTFATEQATNTTSSSATLNGLVEGLTSATTLDFEYGTSPALGSVVAASPAAVSDTAAHNITAALTGLQPNMVYYYRLRGHTASGYEYGDMSVFYTGAVYTGLTTLAATNITDTMVQLNGSVDGLITPATFSFQIGVNTNFDTLIPVYNPLSVTDTQMHAIFAQVSVPYLQPNIQYFYRLIVNTAVGTFYGNTVTFTSGNGSLTAFSTLNPTSVTGSTATLEGLVSHFNTSVYLSFDYGPTTSFGSTVTPTPSSVTDTATYHISATLTGLNPNTVYYYRLRGDYQGGTIYGATKYAYTGPTDIPNWDFQYWYNDTVLLPNYWRLASDHFAQVPGHSGNYALQIQPPSFVILGALGDGSGTGSGPQFYGGSPMNARPDSVIAYLKYDFQPGDTGLMIALAFSGSSYIARGFWPIAGSSGGAWQRVAHAIPYMVPGVIPDSINMGFASVDFGASGPASSNSNDFIAIDDISFSPPLPVAIPNADFEQWFTYGCQRLDSWPDLWPFVGFDYGTQTNSQMITKTYFNPPNDFAARISNIMIAGRVATGSLSTEPKIFGGNNPNISVFINHQTFNGYYKFYPVNNDTLTILVTMFQHGQAIGEGEFLATDTVADFTIFNADITYSNPNSVADSASISITPAYYRARGLSYAVVDKLTFDAYAVGLPDVMPKQAGKIWVYPNPATTTLTIEMDEPSTDARITLIDVSGRVVKVREGQGALFKLDISDIGTGLYLLNVQNGDESQMKKIVIQR